MSDADDKWDFYPCLVDDRPASISLNFRWARATPPTTLDTLYWVRIYMLDPAEHGMGSAAEAEALYPVEDGVIEAAERLGLVQVGRLRNDDHWQLVFYGPPARQPELDAVVAAAPCAGREVETDHKLDADWSYFHKFLMPDRERQQWIKDRNTLEVLERHDDAHEIPRPVSHWSYFATSAARDAFVRDAAKQGFELVGKLKSKRPGAQISRVDIVELDHLHDVVMTLIELAEQHGGEYDGWETSVEQPN